MNVLTVAWNIYDDVKGDFEVGSNGFSVIVSNIVEYIGRVEQSFVMVGDRTVNDREINSAKLIGNERWLPLKRTKSNIDEWHKGLIKCFANAIDKKSIDFVFFHGIGAFVFNAIDYCITNHIKYAVVLHGYYGKGVESNSFGISKEHLDNEMHFIDDMESPIIVVGNGVKRKIVKNNPNINLKRINVIPNGTEKKCVEYNSDLSKRIASGNKRVLSCIASFQPLKNQLQLVRAYSLLPEEIKRNLVVVLCGKDCRKPPYSEQVIKEIKKRGLEKRILYIGELSPYDTKQLYYISDGIILPSLSEGLSVVVLESIMYGKPIIMFSDNPTAEDVGCPSATILVKEKTDEMLADGICRWYYSSWDKIIIKKYAEYYSMERVANDYIQYAKEKIGHT